MALKLGFNYQYDAAAPQKHERAKELERLRSQLAIEELKQKLAEEERYKDIEARTLGRAYGTEQATFPGTEAYNFNIPGQGVLNADAEDTERGKQLKFLQGQQNLGLSGLTAGLPAAFEQAQKSRQNIFKGQIEEPYIPGLVTSEAETKLAENLGRRATAAGTTSEKISELNFPGFFDDKAKYSNALQRNAANRSSLYPVGQGDAAFQLDELGNPKGYLEGSRQEINPIYQNKLGFGIQGVDAKGNPIFKPEMQRELAGQERVSIPPGVRAIGKPSPEARGYMNSLGGVDQGANFGYGERDIPKDIPFLGTSLSRHSFLGQPTIDSSDPAKNPQVPAGTIPQGPGTSSLAPLNSNPEPTQIAPKPQSSIGESLGRIGKTLLPGVKLEDRANSRDVLNVLGSETPEQREIMRKKRAAFLLKQKGGF